MNTETTRDLLDADGENRAVRMFLALYGGTYTITTKQMREHLQECGYPYWPQWAEADQDLTKGGAQDWLRHLFALEKLPSVIPTSGRAAGVERQELTDAQVAEEFYLIGNRLAPQYEGKPVPHTWSTLPAVHRALCIALIGEIRPLLSAAQRDSQPDHIADEVLSRDIFTGLGYVKWENFLGLINRAKNMIENGVAVGRIADRKRSVAIGSGAFREIDDHALDAKAHLLVKLLASSYKLNGHHIARNETAILGMVKTWCEHRGLSAVPQGNIDGKYSDLLIDESISIEFDEPHHDESRHKNKDDEKDRIAGKLGIKTLRFPLQSNVVDIICAIEAEIAGEMVADTSADARDAAGRESMAIGRAMNRAAIDLPAEGEIRIYLENGAGTVYWLDHKRGAWRHVDGGELFSEQINFAIDAAIAASRETPE